jgi:hypothetical protein
MAMRTLIDKLTKLVEVPAWLLWLVIAVGVLDIIERRDWVQGAVFLIVGAALCFASLRYQRQKKASHG